VWGLVAHWWGQRCCCWRQQTTERNVVAGCCGEAQKPVSVCVAREGKSCVGREQLGRWWEEMGGKVEPTGEGKTRWLRRGGLCAVQRAKL
jgi:hypothetical protein